MVILIEITTILKGWTLKSQKCFKMSNKILKNVRTFFEKYPKILLFKLDKLISMGFSEFENSDLISDILVKSHHGNFLKFRHPFLTFIGKLSDFFAHWSIFRHFSLSKQKQLTSFIWHFTYHSWFRPWNGHFWQWLFRWPVWSQFGLKEILTVQNLDSRSL